MDRHFPLWGLLCLAILIDTQNAQASCGTATCPLDLSRSFEKKLQFQFALEDIHQDQLRAGRNKVAFGQLNRPDHDELETQNRNLLLRLDYQKTPRWPLSLTWPLVYRQNRHISIAGHIHDDGHEHGKLAVPQADDAVETWRFTRIADPVLSAHFTPRQGLILSFGLSAPLGSTKTRNDALTYSANSSPVGAIATRPVAPANTPIRQAVRASI
jgi:hypothetical protein